VHDEFDRALEVAPLDPHGDSRIHCLALPVRLDGSATVTERSM
jgi:hypothetical protein